MRDSVGQQKRISWTSDSLILFLDQTRISISSDIFRFYHSLRNPSTVFYNNITVNISYIFQNKLLKRINLTWFSLAANSDLNAEKITNFRSENGYILITKQLKTDQWWHLKMRNYLGYKASHIHLQLLSLIVECSASTISVNWFLCTWELQYKTNLLNNSL